MSEKLMLTRRMHTEVNYDVFGTVTISQTEGGDEDYSASITLDRDDAERLIVLLNKAVEACKAEGWG